MNKEKIVNVEVSVLLTVTRFPLFVFDKRRLNRPVSSAVGGDVDERRS